MQIFVKAIIFPGFLTPEERWQAQGYPALQVAKQNIRYIMKYANDDDVEVDEILDWMAHHPSTVTYNNCLLLEEGFHLDLKIRAQPKMVPPAQRDLFHNGLLNTMEYFDIEHAVDWSLWSARRDPDP